MQRNKKNRRNSNDQNNNNGEAGRNLFVHKQGKHEPNANNVEKTQETDTATEEQLQPSL